MLVDGIALVADNWADLVDGSIKHPIDHNENNTVLQPVTRCRDGSCFLVWTATNASGQYTPQNFDCLNWTNTGDELAIVGKTTATTSEWTRRWSIDMFACRMRARLYCFEQ